MARHVWSVLCRKAIVDQDNQVSLFEVVEGITLTGVIPPKRSTINIGIQFMTSWIRTDLDVPEDPSKCRARIIAPDGERSRETPEGLLKLDTAPRARWTLVVQSMPFFGAGLYEFEVERQHADGTWHVDARVPMNIELKPNEAERTSSTRTRKK